MLTDFIHSIDEQGLRVRGIEVYQHGKKIASHRWAPNYRYSLHSISKSFTSFAIGKLIEEGGLNLHERIVDIFPECVPDTDMPYLNELEVEHLLTMTTGHVADTRLDPEAGIDEEDGVRYFMRRPIEKKPGTFFFYNNGASYVLSSIITKRTGMSVRDYLIPRLFRPLGIEDPHWAICPLGRNLGYSGLYLNTTELAKFGLLYLNHGVWNRKRLINAEWILRSGEAISDTTPHKDGPDNEDGYGYQFWRCVPRAKAYRADGYLGQFIIISDELDAVIAVSSWEPHAQAILTTLWDTVTPIREENK